MYFFCRDLNKFVVVLLGWLKFDNYLEYYLIFNIKLLIKNKMLVICIVFWIELVFKEFKDVYNFYI